MSTTTPVTIIGKLLARTGLLSELPGQPLVSTASQETVTTNPPGLDPGELGFAKDTGELFIGSDTAYAVFSGSRYAQFPYSNIRVLTESAASVQFIKNVVQTSNTTYSSIVFPANTYGPTGSTEFVWNYTQSNVVTIQYVLVFENLPSAIRKGTLSLVLTNTESNMTDDRVDVGFDYFDFTFPVAYDNLSAFEFSVITDVNGNSTLQYQNNTSINAKVYYQITNNLIQF
jgi:hypothetical protein